jgi:outer membrane protein assembly factor BamB
MCTRDDHHHCQELRPILEVTENAKSSTAIVHIERDLKYIDAAFEKMKSDITNNISDIDKKKKKCLSDISDMRKSLNDHLDKIEKQTVEEMVLAEQNLQVELKKVLVAMETKRTDFDNILQDVNKVKTYATDLQTFIGVNKMTIVVDGEVKKQKGAFNYDLFELKLDFSSKLESFVKDVSKFGVVSVTKKYCSTSLVKEAESQAHIPQESKLGVTPQLTRKTTVNFQTEVNGPVGIRGCDILPDGKLVFTERVVNRLLMFSNNGNYEKDIIRCSGIPYDVSYTGENIVAVTIWDKHEVVFVNVITNSIINTIDIGHRCYGIDFNMNRLAIRVIQLPVPTRSHIVYLDPKGKLIDRINIPGEYTTNISLRDDTIKCTNWKTNTIYCYTLTGQDIWTFKDENVLRSPRGIALDKHRNVYVAGYETNNVVVLSPDGKICREILTQSDGLDKRGHYVSTLTVTSSWYAMRAVKHFFSLCTKCKLRYWTLSMFT